MRGKGTEGERWGKRRRRDMQQRSEGRLSAGAEQTGAWLHFSRQFPLGLLINQLQWADDKVDEVGIFAHLGDIRKKKKKISLLPVCFHWASTEVKPPSGNFMLDFTPATWTELNVKSAVADETVVLSEPFLLPAATSSAKSSPVIPPLALCKARWLPPIIWFHEIRTPLPPNCWVYYKDSEL